MGQLRGLCRENLDVNSSSDIRSERHVGNAMYVTLI